MAAISGSQRRAAGMALRAKRGLVSPRILKGAARQMYQTMTDKELADFARRK